MTPKPRADGLGVIMKKGRVSGQSVLYFVLALVKCTRIYISGANDAP